MVDLFLNCIFYKFRLKFITASFKSFKENETHMIDPIKNKNEYN